jgi:3-phosphoshikimate 1-carboxyvinyltransferase
MPDRLKISPTGPTVGSIRPPGSKSITNRALMCAALADGESTLRGALDSDDTRVMIDGLGRLGIEVRIKDGGRTIRVAGCGGKIPAQRADLQVGNSGTTIRFLTSLATLGRGEFRLDGVERMRQRPIGDLLAALRLLGANVQSEFGNDCPPVIVHASGLAGGTARVRGEISSQFLSGLLMAAPCARQNVELLVEGELVSQPYVKMTLAVMRTFGIEVPSSDLSRFEICAPQSYQSCQYEIEPDASAASYFWAAAAITGGRVRAEGLSRNSLQGDIAFCDCLAQMGCSVGYEPNAITISGGGLQGVQTNMNAISDTVQTLAAVALFADGPTTISGVAHIRHKETDRIGDLARELRKLGASVDELADGLRIVPPTEPRGAIIETYNDHRMAMSLALAGLKIPGVVIDNPQCTAKTYPNYFEDLAGLTGKRFV